MWWGMLALIMNAMPEFHPVWLCPLSEIPDIYWAIFIQSVKSLMFSMCYLTTLQFEDMFPSVSWWEFVSDKRGSLTQFPHLPLITNHVTCIGLRTLPWQFEKRKNSLSWRLRRDFRLVLSWRCNIKYCVHCNHSFHHPTPLPIQEWHN